MAFTNIPDVPLYTGSAPNRNTQQQAEFSTNSDDSLQYQTTLADNINTTSAAMNVLADEVQVVADSAQTSADDSQTSANDAQASADASASNANFKGKWVDQSGAANIPYSVSHNGDNWQLLSNVADVTASEPSTANADWIVIIGQLVIIARSLNVLDSEVIYSTDTATVLTNVKYIHNRSTKITWSKPSAVIPGELIDTVVNDQLTTNTPNVYTLTSPTLSNFATVPEMIAYPLFSLSQRVVTGSTTWLINANVGLSVAGGLFAKPLNGLWLNDWNVDETGVVNCDDALEEMLITAELIGARCKAFGKDAIYLTTRQHTVRHGTSLDFQFAQVNFVQSTTNNDSPFQMGNNSELKNISKGTYNSTSASAFGTSGWVKVGEFYALISGAPSSGDNSLDNSYWEPDNVTVTSVSADMSAQLTEDSRGYNATVAHFSATSCTYKHIVGDGLCADGNPSKATRAVIRTETGVDINAGRQGYNLTIEDIKGFNLRAQSENAVVYINGDRNAHIKGVYGENCGAILGIRPNRLLANQDPSMQGLSGLNILAEDITGINCRKVAGDVSTHLLSALYLRSNEGDTLSNNKSSFIVRNLFISSTTVTADKLPLGAQMGDTVALPSETNIGCRRVTLDGFEIAGFINGFNEETGCINNNIRNGFIRDNDSNGGNLNGLRSHYQNIKVWKNNQAAQVDANNGHGLRIACKQGVLTNIDFGDESLGDGNETQKSSLFISADDTTARLNNCHFDNNKTGESILGTRAVTGANVYVDQFCTSKFITISKGAGYHLSPDVVKCAGVFNTAGATQFQLECTVAKGAVGKYDVTFDKPMANTNFRVLATSNFQYCVVRTTLKTVNGFQIAAKTDAGVDVDTGFDFNVYGDYSTLE